MNPDVSPCAWPGTIAGRCRLRADRSVTLLVLRPEQARAAPTSSNTPTSENCSCRCSTISRSSLPPAARSSRSLVSARQCTRSPASGIRCPGSQSAARSAPTTRRRPPASSPGEVTSGLSLISSAGNRYLNVSKRKRWRRRETRDGGGRQLRRHPVLRATCRSTVRCGPAPTISTSTIIDEIKTVSHNQILNTVFVAQTRRHATDQLLGCADRPDHLPQRAGHIRLRPGHDIGADVTSIRSVRGNGPGAAHVRRRLRRQLHVRRSWRRHDGVSSPARMSCRYEIDAFTLNGTTADAGCRCARLRKLLARWRHRVGVASKRRSTTLSANHNLRYVYSLHPGREGRSLSSARQTRRSTTSSPTTCTTSTRCRGIEISCSASRSRT